MSVQSEREQIKELFIEYFEDVPVIKYASYYAGITEQTAHNWLKEDEEFLSLVNQAKARWAKKRALKTRAEFQLERLDKEIWREQKDLVTDGQKIQPATVIDLGNLDAITDKPQTEPDSPDDKV